MHGVSRNMHRNVTQHQPVEVERGKLLYCQESMQRGKVAQGYTRRASSYSAYVSIGRVIVHLPISSRVLYVLHFGPGELADATPVEQTTLSQCTQRTQPLFKPKLDILLSNSQCLLSASLRLLSGNINRGLWCLIRDDPTIRS